MFRVSTSFIAMVSLGAVATVLPGVIAPTPAFAQGAGTVIPERTEVRLALNQELKSGESKEGSEIEFTVRRDVTDENGKVLIKEGTYGYGKVVQSKRRGAFGAPGKLNFSCEYIAGPNHTKILLRGTSMASYGKDNRSATVATAVLLAPVALFINGRDVTVKKGEEYTMYVDKTTTVKAGTEGGTEEASGVAPTPGKTSGAKSVYLTKDGKAYVGSLVSFDGQHYTIMTDKGQVKLATGDVKTVTPIQ